MGWIYLNEYLSHFGLYLANLTVPFHYIFVFSYAPLLDTINDPSGQDYLRLLILVLLIFGCIVAYKRGLVFGYLATLLCFFFVLFIFFQVARDRGKLLADHVLTEGGGQPIRFDFKGHVRARSVGGDSVISRKLITDNDEETAPCLRLIWRTEEAVYVFNQCGLSKKPVYRIPVSTFVFLEKFQNPN